MQHSDEHDLTSRRRFIQYLAMLGIGGVTLLRSGDLKAAVLAAKGAADTQRSWPEMTYRVLGRTGYRASRLISAVARRCRAGARTSY